MIHWLRFCLYLRMAFRSQAVALANAVSMNKERQNTDFGIPVYVTVPIATAQCCPHCGKHFAELGKEVKED